MNRITWSFLVGFIAFILVYVALMGFAIVRFSYYSGPLPDLLLAIPIPLLVGALAGAVAFRLKDFK